MWAATNVTAAPKCVRGRADVAMAMVTAAVHTAATISSDGM